MKSHDSHTELLGLLSVRGRRNFVHIRNMLLAANNISASSLRSTPGILVRTGIMYVSREHPRMQFMIDWLARYFDLTNDQAVNLIEYGERLLDQAPASRFASDVRAAWQYVTDRPVEK